MVEHLPGILFVLMILYIICTGGVRGEGPAEASAVFVVLGKATNRLKK